jgi:hypothetical protein
VYGGSWSVDEPSHTILCLLVASLIALGLRNSEGESVTESKLKRPS